MSVTFSADIWDGREAHDGLAMASVSTEAEAVQQALAWAKSLASVPGNAWLRVNINGALRSFRLGEERWGSGT